MGRRKARIAPAGVVVATMKAILEFELPEEQEELETATRAMDWKWAVEQICERIVAWKCGKPEPFPGRQLEEPIGEMEPVLDYIGEVLAERNLRLD
jgi:hypothetical protein